MRAAIKTLATKDDLADFRQYIIKYNNDVIRWMFIFWLGQIGATLAIMLLFLKK